MKGYMLIAAVLRFVIEFLLLLGANRICMGSCSMVRCLLAAGIGGMYSLLCMLPGMDFLGNMFWYGIFLLIVGWMCFGWNRDGVRPVAVFSLLNLVLDSVVRKNADIGSGLLGILALLVLCYLGFRDGSGGLVPVQLVHADKQISLMALRDTGNTLTDPISGQPVLVIGAQIASKLTGLTQQQLRTPVESIGLLPGLRLVPYRTIGQSGSFMLAMKLQEVKIGDRKGSTLVAFAPECLGSKGTYQALTGGTV